jgi:hypothetical protein
MRDFPNFFKNIWKFRTALWNHHWWDYSGTLEFIEIGINDMAKNISIKGIEVNSSRMKKVTKMRRVVEILRNIREDRYFDIVETEMGRGLNGFNYDFTPSEDYPGYFEMVDNDTEEEQDFKHRYFDRMRELEKKEWDELWNLLKGQDLSSLSEKESYDDHYDGSGLLGWWD